MSDVLSVKLTRNVERLKSVYGDLTKRTTSLNGELALQFLMLQVLKYNNDSNWYDNTDECTCIFMCTATVRVAIREGNVNDRLVKFEANCTAGTVLVCTACTALNLELRAEVGLQGSGNKVLEERLQRGYHTWW